MAEKKEEESLAGLIGKNTELSGKEKLSVVWRLSVPAILAQITSIIMQYIDAAMVGELGASASASIGVVSTSTWLLGGLCSALSVGFSVQTAHRIGAGDERSARDVVKNALMAAVVFSFTLMAAGVFISGRLPGWLGAEKAIWRDASGYFFIYAVSLPAVQLNGMAGSMLQCSGDMKTPGLLNACMCGEDVVFNMIFISRFGVTGAAIGTALAQAVTAALMLWRLCFGSPALRMRKGEPWKPEKQIFLRALRIGLPIGFENIALCGAQIASTRIIAPLGSVAIAANSFAVTVESLCYMPGYGIGTAATTLVGQSMGAGNRKLAKNFANLSVLLGCVVMTAGGVLMFFLCPVIFSLLTPDPQVRELGVHVLRIELFAEPLYAASIVSSGALRGAGDSLVPSILNLVSMWGVRLTISVVLVGRIGLSGAWIAMAVELCVRGILLFTRLQRGKWLGGDRGGRIVLQRIHWRGKFVKKITRQIFFNMLSLMAEKIRHLRLWHQGK